MEKNEVTFQHRPLLQHASAIPTLHGEEGGTEMYKKDKRSWWCSKNEMTNYNAWESDSEPKLRLCYHSVGLGLTCWSDSTSINRSIWSAMFACEEQGCREESWAHSVIAGEQSPSQSIFYKCERNAKQRSTWMKQQLFPSVLSLCLQPSLPSLSVSHYDHSSSILTQ